MPRTVRLKTDPKRWTTINKTEDVPEDKDGIKHGGEDVIMNLVRYGIDVDRDVSHSKDDHRAGAGGHGEGWGCLLPPSY